MSTEPRQQEFGLRETDSIQRVEDYEFEPIQGYPMLRWKGKRPFTSTQYYPAQHKETHGPEIDGWRSKIYWGDNLQVMSHLLRKYRGKIKLIYIDPPFDSKADYKRTISVKGKVTANDQNVFEEKQYTDIWTNDEYLQFIYERLILLRELLSDDGSLYLHCDWHKSHHLRLILDEIFGNENYRNTIIWQKIRSSKAQSNRYGNVCDTILFYSKTDNIRFSPQKVEHADSYLESHYRYTDDVTGKKYRLDNFSQKGQGQSRYFGDRGLLAPSAGKHWIWTQERIDEGIKKGLIVFSKDGIPSVKRFLDEVEGNFLEDLWTDIPPLNSQAGERLNYPTQKPEALLDRIISISSKPGDLIFDCFMGSGTLQAVAMKLGRRFIGADINLGAVQITTKRLLVIASSLSTQSQTLIPEEDQLTTFYTGFEIYNINNYDIFRNPIQAKELLIQALEVNPLPAGSLFDGEKDGRLVKIMPINRIATRQDLNELITGFDYKTFEQRQAEHPNQVVEKVTLICMGHEPDLAAHLKHQMSPFKLDIEIVDILRDKQDLHFKRDSEAMVIIKDGYLIIEQFYPLNLMNKLSETKEDVEEWRQLVETIMIDWNYDGAVLQPAIIDVPEGNTLVFGRYQVPDDAGTIRVKITDLLSESLEVEITHG